MGNDLVVKKQYNDSLMELESNQRLCKMLMQTPHFRKLGEEGIFAILIKAKSLNINPLDALGGLFYYVQGKVGMSSEMMATLVRQSGHSIVKDAKSDNTVCILHGTRKDNGDTWTVSFSMDDAKRAGLAKNMYEKYPAVMLYNRAMSMLARQLFPDVIKGCGYTPDELHEIKNNSQNSHQQIEPVMCNAELIEEKVVPTITQEQAEMLNLNFSLTSPEFKTKVMEWLKIKDEKDFVLAMKSKPSVQYEVFLGRMKDAANSYQMSLTDKPEAQIEVQREAA